MVLLKFMAVASLAIVATADLHQGPRQTEIKEITKDTQAYEGDDRTFTLLTSFDDQVPENGTVWVIESFEIDREKYLYALISFLERPVNVCFDKRHSYLYVA